jgi:hypothetical protein
MAEITPELLIGMLVVVLLLALGLILFLLRAFRRSGSTRTAPKSGGEGTDVARPTTAASDGAPDPTTAKRLASVTAPHTRPDSAPSTPGVRLPAAANTPATNPAPSGLAPLLQVWQDQDGSLVIEIEGHRYRRLIEIRDGAVGRRLLQTINRLVAFSKGQEPQPIPAAEPATGQAPTDLVAAPVAAELLEDEYEAVIEEIRQEERSEPPKSRITADPIPFRRRSLADDAGLTLDLAGEIDRLVQIRVQSSETVGRRHVRVANAPDGTLRFDVDGISYAALDEIPDEGVRSLIRAAISDWERRR